MYARRTIPFLMLCTLLCFTSCQEKLADRFEREAKEFTQKNCPQKMEDGMTCLDSMVFVPSADKEGECGDLKLYYSLEMSDEAREILMDNLGELCDMNLGIIRNSLHYTKYKEAGASFTYIYYDAIKEDKIVEYHYTKKDYE